MTRFAATGLAAALALTLSGAVSTADAQGNTLATVKSRGMVNCGVAPGVPGFAFPDDKGNWTGLDVDFCRAVAAALFNDPKKVSFKPLTAKERFTALQSGEIDVLSRTTTWTMSRDSAMGLSFVGIMYVDGQGLMVPKKLGVKSAKELNGASVCVATGTTTELNLADYFRSNNMTYKPVVFEKADEVNAAYDAGRCDVYTTDAVRPLCPAPAPQGPRRPRGAARDHLQGAAGPVGAPGRLPVVHAQQVGLLRAAQCRGARRDEQERRRDAQVDKPRDQAPARHRRRVRQGHRSRQRLGREASSRASATTARSTSATSARTRRSRSPAASTISGPKAEYSTPRRSDSGARRSRRRSQTAAGASLILGAGRPPSGLSSGGARRGVTCEGDRHGSHGLYATRGDGARRARSTSSTGPRCDRSSSRSFSSLRSALCSG